MKESILVSKSKSFALDVVKMCKKLRLAKCESVIINQFIPFPSANSAKDIGENGVVFA